MMTIDHPCCVVLVCTDIGISILQWYLRLIAADAVPSRVMPASVHSWMQSEACGRRARTAILRTCSPFASKATVALPGLGESAPFFRAGRKSMQQKSHDHLRNGAVCVV